MELRLSLGVSSSSKPFEKASSPETIKDKNPSLFSSDSVKYREDVGNKRSLDDDVNAGDRGSNFKASDHEDQNGITRKKLRLSKQQSAFLEQSFMVHSSTLNPKQKHALAKQLNLRPRQVEVWFQNRRARKKLKQTELDCEYLKKYFETLTEENRKLQNDLEELRALKISSPFYKQSPATSLTMCPSCHKRVATSALSSTTTTVIATEPPTAGSLTPLPFPLSSSHKGLISLEYQGEQGKK